MPKYEFRRPEFMHGTDVAQRCAELQDEGWEIFSISAAPQGGYFEVVGRKPKE